MLRGARISLPLCGLLLLAAVPLRAAHPQQAAKATLSNITLTGLKTLSAEQLLPETGLKIGDLAGRDDLQAAANRLLQLGLFTKVSYEFRTLPEGLTVNFRAEEAPRVPVFFDNVPWFADSELTEAIRKALPFYDGTAPEDGGVVERIAAALSQFLEAHQLHVAVEHQLLANPLGDGMVQLLRISGTALKIARLDFSDPEAAASHNLQLRISDLLGKPYSRLAIELFLAEQVRPAYLRKGFLRVKLGPPEIRLSGPPGQALPESLPVYVPVTPGPVYRWQGAQWSGITALSPAALHDRLGLEPNDVADALAIEAAWDRVREEYGHRGYLDVRLDPQPLFDDQAHTLSYRVALTEGPQYRCGKLVITGVSLAAEKRIRAAWPVPEREIFDKLKFEEFLGKLQRHREEIFGDLPLHYGEVGHWLRTDPETRVVDILLDFK
ncbi:MAG: hypothetical protein LAN84_16750 [Acidobacteriia bacterium]|nr:hypothetical protein [Terriglobia bacterium]